MLSRISESASKSQSPKVLSFDSQIVSRTFPKVGYVWTSIFKVLETCSVSFHSRFLCVCSFSDIISRSIDKYHQITIKFEFVHTFEFLKCTTSRLINSSQVFKVNDLFDVLIVLIEFRVTGQRFGSSKTEEHVPLLHINRRSKLSTRVLT